jgi:hypothetical protein
MTLYRSFKPKTSRHKSPRKAARERIAPGVERLTGEVVVALPAVPNKVEQLEALVKAGRVADPLAGIANESAPHPDPLPASAFALRASADRSGEREQTAQAAPAPPQPTLLQRTQYLYEQTVVPVREIARLIGVSERTLYKYVARYGWTRRHLCIARPSGADAPPRDYEAVRTANCGRTLQPREGHEGVKGAGGRFISFEERGTPQALSLPCGPKALDPLAAEAAGGLCERAALSSNVAISEVIAAATIEDANERAGRIGEASARTVADAARILRQAATAALAGEEREAASHAELKRQLAEKGAELRRVEAARQHLQRELDIVLDREREAAHLARVQARAGAENEANDAGSAGRVRSDPLRGPRIRRTWD